ncbi:MAG: SCO family protein [Calditrichae bacterium]|nr:SCO family protein [Calditrichota bacterium]MCB9058037.1 SCO family protein [Calditrichia bacterium]
MRLFLIFLFFINGAYAQRVRDDLSELKRINVTEKLGKNIPLDVDLINEQGQEIKLSDFFNKDVPVIFTFAYYECPMLCTQVLNSLSSSINRLDWESKDKYQVVTVSIDSGETAESAVLKKKIYVSTLDDSTLQYNWSFLTARQSSIDTLTKALGFEYYYIEDRDEFAHPAVIFVLSPEGKITRYLYGLYYEPKDLKLALLEASKGQIGNTIDKLILYCFHYDETSNTYVLFAQNLMRLGGIFTMIILGLFLGGFWMREKRKKKKSFQNNLQTN